MIFQKTYFVINVLNILSELLHELYKYENETLFGNLKGMFTVYLYQPPFIKA